MSHTKVKYEDLKNVMDYLEKNAPGQSINVYVETSGAALVFDLTNSAAEKTQIRIPNSELGRFVTITEEKWLHKVKK
ncbi:MAG: hypothetical protein A4S09_05075 [Proteobacteria bacterium SG_bin7]|nr:MAG: hypothetical protein A4S09_05075 [Proteobacteria bacterium SG_bin7]